MTQSTDAVWNEAIEAAAIYLDGMAADWKIAAEKMRKKKVSNLAAEYFNDAADCKTYAKEIRKLKRHKEQPR